MAHALPIGTERLILRRYLERDFDDLLKLQSNDQVARFAPYAPKTPEEVRASLAKRLAEGSMARDGDALTAAVLLRTTGQHLGETTLFMHDVQNRCGEIGFAFHPSVQGHGFATEAAVEMLRLGFEGFGMHRIIGRLDPRNTGSAKVLQRLGMRQEAHFVRSLSLKGEWVDDLVFAMLADEWRSATGE